MKLLIVLLSLFSFWAPSTVYAVDSCRTLFASSSRSAVSKLGSLSINQSQHALATDLLLGRLKPSKGVGESQALNLLNALTVRDLVHYAQEVNTSADKREALTEKLRKKRLRLIEKLEAKLNSPKVSVASVLSGYESNYDSQPPGIP